MGELAFALLLMFAVVVPLVGWAVRADKRRRAEEPVTGSREEVA